MDYVPIKDFLKQKRQSKEQMAKVLSLTNTAVKRPLLGIFIDNELTKTSEEKLRFILEGAQRVNVEVVILADSNLELSSLKHVKILPYNRGNRKLLLEAADMSLVFKFNDVEEMLLHGTIPISSRRPEVKDYDPNHETGNAFIYKREDPWAIFAALVRATETFKFSYDWKHIVRQGVESVLKR